jgi:hypothetical protein
MDDVSARGLIKELKALNANIHELNRNLKALGQDNKRPRMTIESDPITGWTASSNPPGVCHHDPIDTCARCVKVEFTPSGE